MVELTVVVVPFTVKFPVTVKSVPTDNEVVVARDAGAVIADGRVSVIEPVAFGLTKKRNPVVRAWDREGASHTSYLGKKPLPGWRFFRVDKMQFIRPTQETFDTPRPNYNPNGDRSMERVFINAIF